jgi:hypothetical protein
MTSNPKPQDRQFLEARARRPSWKAGVSVGVSFGVCLTAFTIVNDLYERAGLALQPPLTHMTTRIYLLDLAINLTGGIAGGVAVIGLIRLWRKFRLLL